MSGGWWQTVFGCGDGDARAVQRLLEPAQPVVLPPIERAEDRRRIIADILRRSGSVVHPPEAGEAPEFDHQLTSLTWGGEPLFLMMAGLRAAEVGFGAVLTLSRDDLALSIADRELDRIGRDGISPPTMAGPHKSFLRPTSGSRSIKREGARRERGSYC